MTEGTVIIKEISVWLSPHGVSFLRQGEVVEKLVSADETAQVEFVRRLIEEQQLTLEQITLVVDSVYYTLIPSELYEERLARPYFDAVVGAKGHLCQCMLTCIDSMVVYALSEAMYTFFAGQQIVPSIALVIDDVMQRTRKGSSLYFYPGAELSSWVLIKNGVFDVCHSKAQASEANMTYYTMSTWMAFDYDSLEDTLCVVGGSQPIVDRMLELFRTYIAHVELLTPNSLVICE